MHNIHFGNLGLKPDELIIFIKTGVKFIVSSGNDTPDNGGTMIRYLNSSGIDGIENQPGETPELPEVCA